MVWLCRPIAEGVHYDFIEVGTSDWGTITQFCADPKSHEGSSLGMWIRDYENRSWDSYGLAVEPVLPHLKALPSLRNVTKVEAAMGEFSGRGTIYGVTQEDIECHWDQVWAEHNGREVNVMYWAKSMSMIGKPHPELSKMLREAGKEELMHSKQVKMLAYEDLCKQYNVASVNVMQLDCEGADCAVLRGLLRHCEQFDNCFPMILQFEAHWLQEPEEVRETLHALLLHGYHVIKWNNDILLQRVDEKRTRADVAAELEWRCREVENQASS
jgi:FkbM family methyltransferase